MKFLAAVSRQRSALPVDRLPLRKTLIVSRVSVRSPVCLAKGDSDIRKRRAVISTSESGNANRDVDWMERRKLNRT